MAHRTNVIQVLNDLKSNKERATVTDPVCGMQLDRKDSRHVLIRDEETFYFCSKACQLKFTSPGFGTVREKKKESA